jgi:type II secretory pathway pseudopilin PulG
MLELMLVVATLAVVFTMVIPRMTVMRDGTALRAGRQQLTAAFAAARAAALQKGKTSTLTLAGNKANVTVLSGLASTSVKVLGPIDLLNSVGVTLTPIGSAPTSITYNARGLLTPTPGDMLRYRISAGARADTLCVSPAGIILKKGCTL